MPEESREEVIPGTVRITPEPSKAVFAIETALRLYETAKTDMENRRYDDAYAGSKNAIRMASAAIMYNDGYVANTMEGAYEYIEKNYGDKMVVGEWKDVEIKAPENKGIIETILEIIGIRRRKEGEEAERAEKALSVAKTFIESARVLLSAGSVVAWETTVRGE